MMEAGEMQGSETSSGNNVMCLLTDPEGEPLGSSLYLPQNVGPPQLQEIVNKLLSNVSNPLLNLRFLVSL